MPSFCFQPRPPATSRWVSMFCFPEKTVFRCCLIIFATTPLDVFFVFPNHYTDSVGFTSKICWNMATARNLWMIQIPRVFGVAWLMNQNNKEHRITPKKHTHTVQYDIYCCISMFELFCFTSPAMFRWLVWHRFDWPEPWLSRGLSQRWVGQQLRGAQGRYNDSNTSEIRGFT